VCLLCVHSCPFPKSGVDYILVKSSYPVQHTSLAVLIVPEERKSLLSGGNIMYYTTAERSTWNFALCTMLYIWYIVQAELCPVAVKSCYKFHVGAA
jgi:hypothetical protein